MTLELTEEQLNAIINHLNGSIRSGGYDAAVSAVPLIQEIVRQVQAAKAAKPE